MARNSDHFMREAEATSSSEEELVPAFETRQGSNRKRAAFAAIAVGMLCLAGACAFAPRATAGTPQPNLRAPVTVRSLLEGDAIADLATDNMMAMGGEQLAQVASRGEVREAVARKLLNISDTIKERYPEDHKKLELISLSAVQKDAVFKVLRHYSDERMLALSRDVSDAVQETAKESGDEAALNRRLGEKLRPRAAELQRLGEILFPARHGNGVELNFKDAPESSSAKKWNVEVGMSIPQRQTQSISTARRLSAEDLSSGVTVQAQSFFESLQQIVGDDMPSAPARMLFQQQQSSASHGEASFMDCMMKAMSDMNPMGAVGCMMSNIQVVFKMVSQVLMGGAR